jgi:hypothetical protein
MSTPVYMSERINRQEEQLIERQLLRMNLQGWGVAMGLLFGLGLFIATNVLVIRGGPNVGAHLGLLSIYLPGYSVTYLGSLIGFVYAFVIGYGIGRTIGAVYNRLVDVV